MHMNSCSHKPVMENAAARPTNSKTAVQSLPPTTRSAPGAARRWHSLRSTLGGWRGEAQECGTELHWEGGRLSPPVITRGDDAVSMPNNSDQHSTL